jgi:hypothetical protein
MILLTKRAQTGRRLLKAVQYSNSSCSVPTLQLDIAAPAPTCGLLYGPTLFTQSVTVSPSLYLWLFSPARVQTARQPSSSKVTKPPRPLPRDSIINQLLSPLHLLRDLLLAGLHGVPSQQSRAGVACWLGLCQLIA